MAEVVRKDVEFVGYGGAKISAYQVRPKRPGKVPGILFESHSSSGVAESVKQRADMLAEEGYCVLAPDLYCHLPRPIKDSQAAFRSLTDEQVIGDLDAALELLKGQDVIPDRFGITGFCAGIPIVYASHNPRIAACVSFFNQLKTVPEWNHPKARNPMDWAKSMRSAWLGLYGDVDPYIPVDHLEEFEQMLKRRGVTYQLQIYRGDNVGHGFLSEGGPSYKPERAQDAWKRAVDFFEQHLKKPIRV